MSGYKESTDSIIIIVVDSILAVMKLVIITCAKTHTHTLYNPLPPFSSGGRYVIVPILQMWKPRFGEVKSQAQVTQPELTSQDSPEWSSQVAIKRSRMKAIKVSTVTRSSLTKPVLPECFLQRMVYDPQGHTEASDSSRQADP